MEDDPRDASAGLLVLVLDTAAPLVSAALCRVAAGPTAGAGTADEVEVLARWAADVPQHHGELASVAVREVLVGGGVARRDLDAVVVGAGPGPFTGLRVGLVTAAALGHALDVPVHGAVSLDALARPDVTVVTDARRREVYAAGYGPDGTRVHGPDVAAPAALADRLPDGATVVLGPGTSRYSDVLTAGGCRVEPGPEVLPVERLLPGVLDAVRSRQAPGPVAPLYLRRPDAVPMTQRPARGAA